MTRDVPRMIINEKDQSVMVLVPAGEFIMGTSAKELDFFISQGGKKEWFEDEMPQRIVYLPEFYVDKYLVTNHQYNKFLNETGRPQPEFWSYPRYSHPYQPVVGVDWDEASAYCEWAGKRLLTEAEWEKAARGTDGRIYPWGNDFDSSKSNSCSKIGRPSFIGEFSPGESPYGVQDMAGNVWEWVYDFYSDTYYHVGEYKNPKGPKDGEFRCVRGGCWINEEGFLRCASRDHRRPPRFSLEYFGFRAAKSVTDELLDKATGCPPSSLPTSVERDDNIVSLRDFAPPEITEYYTEIKPENIPLDVIYEDDHIIVINKPARMLVHPGSFTKTGTLVAALRFHTKDKLSWKGGPDRLGIVHRLDRDTSGVMIAAKSDVAFDSLKYQFMVHNIKRVYNAIVCGIPPQDHAKFTIPIGKDDEIFDKMAVKYFFSKEATTHMDVLENFGEFSLVELELETGRTHQIRLHLSHVGLPVVGDPKYGGKERAFELATHNANLRDSIARLRRQALHARVLGIIHPTKREYMEFSSPIPSDMQDVIDVLSYLGKRSKT